MDRYLRRGMPFLSEWTDTDGSQDETFNFYVGPQLAAQWLTEAMRESRAWHRIYASAV